MIDFILSKLGILLFAVTVAGLLLYFSSNIKDVFLADETVQISNTIAKQIKYMAESDNLCASTRVILPRYIDVFGISNSASYSSIYYFLDISISEQNSNGDKFIIFSIVNKQTKKQIALESFKSNAKIILYDSDSKVGKETDGLRIDPTAKSVVYMIKNRTFFDNQEKTEIYFVNCKYNTDNLIAGQDPFAECYTQLDSLKEYINSNSSSNSSQKYPFFCVPTITNKNDLLNS